MPMIRDVYARSHTAIGVITRHFDSTVEGRWSHSACIVDTMGKSFIVEARLFDGVVVAGFTEFMMRYRRTAIVEYEVEEDIGANQWLMEQIGKPYDIKATMGIAFGRNWESPHAWMCRELCEARLALAGRRRFRSGPHRITPNLGYAVI